MRIAYWDLETWGRPVHRYNYMNGITNAHRSTLGPKLGSVLRAVAEAWAWLEYERLLVPDPDQREGPSFITRRGERFLKNADVVNLMAVGLLPTGVLEPVLAGKVRAPYLRGDYDVAVLQAFKAVEVRVRKLSGLPDELVSVNLMRAAFDPKKGPLADQEQLAAEREATAHLFAGAIGLFRNPTAHREVEIDALEAVELIYLADRLICTAERHAKVGDRPSPNGP